MPSVILNDAANGPPIIFFGSSSWQRRIEKGSSDANKSKWLERTPKSRPIKHEKLAQFLEHLAHHPEEATLIDKDLVLDDEDTAAQEWINNRVAKLDALIVRTISSRREAKICIGKALIEQKRILRILGHGHFQKHLADVLGPFISIRSAERYMEFARNEATASESDKLSFLKSASDDFAEDVKKSTQQAKAEVDGLSDQKRHKQRIAPYQLPLRLNPDDSKAADALQESVHWFEAENALIGELRRLCAEYCSETNANEGGSNEANFADA